MNGLEWSYRTCAQKRFGRVFAQAADVAQSHAQGNGLPGMQILSPLRGSVPHYFCLPTAYAVGCILPPLRGSVLRCLAQSAGSFCGAQDWRLGTQDSLQDSGLRTQDSLQDSGLRTQDSLQRAIPLRLRHIHWK